MRLLAAFLLSVLASTEASTAQVTVYNDLGQDDFVLRTLASYTSELPRLEPLDAVQDLETASGILLAVEVYRLQELAESGSLVAAEFSDFEPPFRGPESRYAITLLSPYVVAYPDLPGPSDGPESWDELISTKYQDRLVVGTPIVMPELWDMWWKRELRRGEDRRQAVAWLTTLDARIQYASSGTEVRQTVLGGGADFGILPRHLLIDQGVQHVLVPGEVAAVGLGVAALSGADDPETAAVMAVLVSYQFNRRLAAALGMIPAPRAGENLVSRSRVEQQILGGLQPWMLDSRVRAEREEIWRSEIRGRGRDLEGLSETLDLVLGLVIIGFLVFVYTRIRKSEPRSGRTPRSD